MLFKRQGAIFMKKPKQHPIGMTCYRDPGNDPGGPNLDLLASPADFIAPGMDVYRDDPPAADGYEVIVPDADHIGGDASWVWKTFTRGMNPIYTNRWNEAKSGIKAIRVAMGSTRQLAKQMNLPAMIPHGELTLTRHCLASLGNEYMIYQPKPGDSFSVDLKAGTYVYEWLAPDKHAAVKSGTTSRLARRRNSNRRSVKTPCCI